MIKEGRSVDLDTVLVPVGLTGGFVRGEIEEKRT